MFVQKYSKWFQKILIIFNIFDNNNKVPLNKNLPIYKVKAKKIEEFQPSFLTLIFRPKMVILDPYSILRVKTMVI